MSSFLDKLFKGRRLANMKTSAEFEDAVKKLEAELRNIVAERDSIEARREQALFTGDGDLTAIRKQASDLDERVEIVSTALSGARKRQAEAIEREQQEAVESRMATARGLYGEQLALVQRYHQQATTLAQTLGQLRDVGKAIEVENAFAYQSGRNDLAVPSVFATLHRAAQTAYAESNKRRGVDPVNSTLPPIVDPSVQDNVKLEGGYWQSTKAKYLDVPLYALAQDMEP